MRLVDFFIDVIVFIRKLEPQLTDTIEYDRLKNELEVRLIDSCSLAEKKGYEKDVVNSAQFPVVAFIDELILCSNWPHKSRWQQESLQRKFYDTTNIGSEFYSKLNELSKYGPDEWVREVYILCLGLGFKGRYFSNDDRRALEEIKEFNIGLLLPDKEQRKLDTATLFPTAYGENSRDGGNFKSRLNVIPYIIGPPVLMLVALVLYYHFNVTGVMENILKAVN